MCVTRNQWSANHAGMAQVMVDISVRHNLEKLVLSLPALWSGSTTAGFLGRAPLVMLMDEDDENTQTMQQCGNVSSPEVLERAAQKERTLFHRPIRDIMEGDNNNQRHAAGPAAAIGLHKEMFETMDNDIALADCVYHYAGISATHNATLLQRDQAERISRDPRRALVRMKIPDDYYGFNINTGRVVVRVETDSAADEMDVIKTVTDHGFQRILQVDNEFIQLSGRAVVQLIVPLAAIEGISACAVSIADHCKFYSEIPVITATLHGGNAQVCAHKHNALHWRNISNAELLAALEACSDFCESELRAWATGVWATKMKAQLRSMGDDSADLETYIAGDPNPPAPDSAAAADDDDDDDAGEEDDVGDADGQHVQVAAGGSTATDMMNVFFCVLRWSQKNNKAGIYCAIVSKTRAGRAVTFK